MKGKRVDACALLIPLSHAYLVVVTTPMSLDQCGCVAETMTTNISIVC